MTELNETPKEMLVEIESVAKEVEGKMRYYYYEVAPVYGFRPMGHVGGYNSLEELKEDMRYTIERNSKSGYPMFLVVGRVTRDNYGNK